MCSVSSERDKSKWQRKGRSVEGQLTLTSAEYAINLHLDHSTSVNPFRLMPRNQSAHCFPQEYTSLSEGTRHI